MTAFGEPSACAGWASRWGASPGPSFRGLGRLVLGAYVVASRIRESRREEESERGEKRFESGIQARDESAHRDDLGGTFSAATMHRGPYSVSMNDAWVGDVLDGRYLLLKRVGSGAAGTVWQARDLERDIDVAVKVLASKHLASAEILTRFVREGDLAARMLSPHIVRVLARGVTMDHGPYVVYEHLEGEDLATMLAARGRLSIVDVRTVVVHTCRALGRAHALGVLHRDVKPSNLFVGSDLDGRRVVKTIDFGIAELVGSAREDQIDGTLEYIAPEILFGERKPDVRSDLYALAVVAYECFTGRVPFPAETVEEL